MRLILLVAVLAWPVTLAAALIDRFDDRPALWGTAVYVAASRVCHQRPDRSFHTDGHQWPVCARCAGLYLAAPVGAWLLPGLMGHVRRSTLLKGLAIAAAPTAATWAFEAAGGADPGGMTRALTAAPLGAAVAFAIVSAVAPAGRIDRID